MRKHVWLALLLVLIVPVMLATVSCAKKDVVQEEEAMTEPEAATTEPEVDMDAVEAADRAREDQERLKMEAEAMARDAFVDEEIYFEFDSAALSQDSQIILSSKGSYMKANPDISVTIEGHCDERGTDAYNMALGQRRAEAAMSFLVDMGIDANRLATVSYGEERPEDPGHNEAAWAMNRRDQFVIN
jgi:peptidoglycan-associated lipoprotein